MKGQVTIEFILVLVIMLVILATISLPTIEQMEIEVYDTGRAVNLATTQQKILQTANEISLAGCDSVKNISVHVDSDAFSQSEILLTNTEITAKYFLMNSTEKFLANKTLPENINIHSSQLDRCYWQVQIIKDCNNRRPITSQVIKCD